MRFHLVGLPHTQSTAAYSNCAFNSLLRGMATMMKSLGHEVIVYSGSDNDAPCDEHVTCIKKKDQRTTFGVRGPEDILKAPLDEILYQPQQPWWPEWNRRVWKQMQSRIQPQDFVCIIGGGVLFEPLIGDVLAAGAMPVEYAVGYAGISARTFHAFGASSWRHVVYGLHPAEGWRMSPYDRVVPHYFDPEQFEYREKKDDYFLYLGKVKEDKGVNIAARACMAAGVPLIVAGQGPTPVEYGDERRRYIGPDERKELLAGARGVFVPSLYVEPFGMIAVEALLSGTPIITSDWGGLADINQGGVGFRCNTLQDFVDATKNIYSISSKTCERRGLEYSYANVRHQYNKWFSDLLGLYGLGWDTLRTD